MSTADRAVRAPTTARRAPRLLFPLLVTTQIGSALAFAAYLLDGSPASSEAQTDLEITLLPFSPLVWLGLGLVGGVALALWRSGAWRAAAVVTSWVSGGLGILGSVLVVLVLHYISSYGASFDYPEAVPLPTFAQPVTRAQGADDDDPMRGREVVVDIGAHTPSELVDYYRERFATADGWVDGVEVEDVGGDHLLCLVNGRAGEYDEYLEVYPHGGESSTGGPHRFLVSVSRLYATSPRAPNRCGLAGIWFPSDL